MKRIIFIAAICLLFLISCSSKKEASKEHNTTDFNFFDRENEDAVESASDFSDGIYIVDAINYSKPVIDTVSSNSYNFGNNSVIIPKIPSENPNAIAFNEKIYNDFVKYYDLLIQNNEGSQLINIAYKYEVRNGIIGINVSQKIGLQYSSYAINDSFYYFDTNTYTELTFNEYLTAHGLSFDQATDKINAVMFDEEMFYTDVVFEPVFNEYMIYYSLDERGGKHELKHALFGEDKTVVYFITTDLMSGDEYSSFTIGNIFDIEIEPELYEPIIYLKGDATDEEILEFADHNCENLLTIYYEIILGNFFKYEETYEIAKYDENNEPIYFRRIADPNIKTVADVKKVFHQYFSKFDDASVIDERYVEKNGSVYVMGYVDWSPSRAYEFLSVEHISSNKIEVNYVYGGWRVDGSCTLLLQDGIWMFESFS